jgi:hypothetical protein
VHAVARLESAVARHGIVGTSRLIGSAIKDWKNVRLANAANRAFDREHEVDTAGIIPLRALDVRSRWATFGNRYEATSPRLFEGMFATLKIDFPGFTFIDFGAGKGRALLLASDYPFRRIIGVEFSRELVAVAEQNVARWLKTEHACTDIALVCCDVTDFDLPREPLVLYFYNPFGIEVMSKVLDRVHQSLQETPRPLVIALHGDEPLVAEVLARDFTEIDAGRWPKVFTARSSQSLDSRAR